MAVKIRLKRMGAKKKPFYRLVVADGRAPRDGRFIEEIGTYNPLKEPAEIKVDVEKAQKWLSNGHSLRIRLEAFRPCRDCKAHSSQSANKGSGGRGFGRTHRIKKVVKNNGRVS